MRQRIGLRGVLWGDLSCSLFNDGGEESSALVLLLVDEGGEVKEEDARVCLRAGVRNSRFEVVAGFHSSLLLLLSLSPISGSETMLSVLLDWSLGFLAALQLLSFRTTSSAFTCFSCSLSTPLHPQRRSPDFIEL